MQMHAGFKKCGMSVQLSRFGDDQLEIVRG